MLRRVLSEEPVINEPKVVLDVYESLKEIRRKLEEEMAYKQKTIEASLEEIQLLRKVIGEKDAAILELKNKLDDCQRNSEGNRQLINKLLNDLDRAQQNVDWYKRTYERRSILGVVKDRIKFFFANK